MIKYEVRYQTNHNEGIKEFDTLEDAIIYYEKMPKGGAMIFKVERLV